MPGTDYKADINWGDGTGNLLNSGAITYNSGTHLFEVHGTHTYVADGSYTIHVQLHHELTADPAAVTVERHVSDAVPTVALTGTPAPRKVLRIPDPWPGRRFGETNGETGGLDQVQFYIIHWGDNSANADLYVSPAAVGTGNGSGSDPDNLMAMPGNRQFTHTYADGTVPQDPIHADQHDQRRSC